MQLHEEPPTSMVSIEQPTNITDASHRELLYEKSVLDTHVIVLNTGLVEKMVT